MKKINNYNTSDICDSFMYLRNFVLAVFLLFVFCFQHVFAQNINAPVLINSAEEMAAINSNAATRYGNYILMNDIVLENWVPIGTMENPFLGTFDGNGYTITILSFRTDTTIISSTSVGMFNISGSDFEIISIGLFGVIGNGSFVKNLQVSGNLQYNSDAITLYMGAIAGVNGGVIQNCNSTSNVNARGGLYSSKSGWRQFGISLLETGMRQEAYSQKNAVVYISYQNEACGGGIVGLNMCVVENCYATGNITVSGLGHKNAGGISGRNGFGDGRGGIISYCYATGNITAKEDAASRQAGGITGMCMPGSVLNSVALNEKLEAIGDRKGMTMGGLGAGYPSNIAYGVASYNVQSSSSATYSYNSGGFTYIHYGHINIGQIRNAYYRNDMIVNMAKDEDDEKKSKGNKKNIFYGNRGKGIEFALTQEKSWWMDDKSGVSFSFGTDEKSPWIWNSNLKRPILFWETEEGKTKKRTMIDADASLSFKEKSEVIYTKNEQSPEKRDYFPYCGLIVMKEDLQGKFSWHEANKSCPQGWRLPTVVELKCMCNNKSRLDRFNGKEYWSSEKTKKYKYFSITANDCDDEKNDASDQYFVRCVKDYSMDWNNPDYIYVTLRETGINVIVRDLPQKYTWNDAIKSCPNGWRLPTIEELQKMCENKNKIPLFNEREYWSSTEKNRDSSFFVTTNDCKKESNDKSDTNFVRCVRSN